MKNKLFLFSFILILGLFLNVGLGRAETVKITFPIDELGGCKDTKECKAYCDQLEHAGACADFGQTHGLISKNQAEQNRKFAQVPKGPAGCEGRDACEKYCQEGTHLDECIKFAKEHQLVPDDQLKKMQNFQQSLAAGDTPGNCHDQHTCATFCQERSHNEECLKWAKKHELVAGEDADKIEKFQQFVTKGETPGGCADKDACYQFCSDKTHFDECQKFGEKMGFVKPPAPADLQKKPDMKGPGGCDSRDACEKFCNDPANTQTCIDFASQRGFIKPEQARDIQDTQKQGATIEKLPPEKQRCVKQFLTDDDLEQMKAGKFAPEPDTARQLKDCFAQNPNQDNQVPNQEQKRPLPPQSDQGQPGQNQGVGTKPRFEQKPAGQTPGIEQKPGIGAPLPPRQFPPQMEQCVTQVAGPAALEQLHQGQFRPTEDVKQKIMVCVGQSDPGKMPAPVPNQ
ncbi:MAG TPA: hypothetical protein VGQ87_04085 [Patescibacteria group bacterium]|jgi:hypothetical protein|nr:hypothetical protein [Patescibacteria group bacterium]